jgi:hypothetical protein
MMNNPNELTIEPTGLHGPGLALEASVTEGPEYSLDIKLLDMKILMFMRHHAE